MYYWDFWNSYYILNKIYVLDINIKRAGWLWPFWYMYYFGFLIIRRRTVYKYMCMVKKKCTKFKARIYEFYFYWIRVYIFEKSFWIQENLVANFFDDPVSLITRYLYLEQVVVQYVACLRLLTLMLLDDFSNHWLVLSSRCSF